VPEALVLSDLGDQSEGRAAPRRDRSALLRSRRRRLNSALAAGPTKGLRWGASAPRGGVGGRMILSVHPKRCPRGPPHNWPRRQQKGAFVAPVPRSRRPERGAGGATLYSGKGGSGGDAEADPPGMRSMREAG